MKIKLLFCFLLATFTSLLFAHSGGTDSSGGHYNRSTGSYHYHNSGYSSSSSYSGNCPCPYSTAADGSRCGARSAWSKSGGESPVCFTSSAVSDNFEEWFFVSSNIAGNSYYLEIDSIKKLGRYVYYWELDATIQPTFKAG